MLSKTKKKLSLILYAQDNTPRYFEITKNFYHFYIIWIPLITLILFFIILFIFTYFKQIKIFVKKNEAKIVTTLRDKNQELQKELSSSIILNQTLQKKLTTTPVENPNFLNVLSIFKPNLNQKSFLKKSPITVKSFKFKKTKEKIKICF